MDFGWDHPFAAVELAWDRDADVIYVTKAYRQKEATPVIHAAALKPWGDLPGHGRMTVCSMTKGSGEQLASQYRTQGKPTCSRSGRRSRMGPTAWKPV